jgi:ferrous iron transport protein A
VRLSELGKGASAVVQSVDPIAPVDLIAARLRDIGFVPGEHIRVVTLGPLGAEPMLVQVGYTRFALRRAEAARIRVSLRQVDALLEDGSMVLPRVALLEDGSIVLRRGALIEDSAP